MAEFSFKELSKDANTIVTGEQGVVITKTESAKSQGGKAMIKCDLKITAGPYAGRVIKHNFTMSPENPTAVKMFFIAMKALGLGPEYFDNDPTMEQVAGDLLGRTAVAVLEENVWQGVAREQVKSWKPGDGVALAPSAMSLPAAATTLPTVAARPAAVETSEDAPEDPF